MRIPPFIGQVRQLPRALVLAMCSVLALLIALGGLSFWNIREQAAAANWVSHTYEVGLLLKDIFSRVQDAESAQRMFTMNGVEAYLTPYRTAVQILPDQLSRARRLIGDNPAQVGRFKKLNDDIRARLDLIDARLRQRRELGANATDASLFQGAGVRVMEAVRGDVSAMIAEENRLLDLRLEWLKHARARAIYLQNAAGLLSLGLLVLVFVTLAKLVLRAERAEREAQRTNAQLRDANNEMRSFSYSVAHDLRAPLRGINGFARVLLDDNASLSGEARHALSRITANATTMGELIDALLALSKVSYQPLRSTKIAMSEVVQSAYQELVEGQNGRVVECEIGELPPAAGDPSLLRQVWLNLIGNALKFTRNRPRARIEIGGNVAGPEFATYYIRDNGAGFNMEYAGKMFGAFQRMHRPGEFEGTGIGLALVQRIIQRHGGTIWAEGKENEGARFAFTLPEWTEEQAKA